MPQGGWIFRIGHIPLKRSTLRFEQGHPAKARSHPDAARSAFADRLNGVARQAARVVGVVQIALKTLTAVAQTSQTTADGGNPQGLLAVDHQLINLTARRVPATAVIFTKPVDLTGCRVHSGDPDRAQCHPNLAAGTLNGRPDLQPAARTGDTHRQTLDHPALQIQQGNLRTVVHGDP